MKKEKTVMDSEVMDRSLTRIAYEILEKNKGTEGIVLVGIGRAGFILPGASRRK